VDVLDATCSTWEDNVLTVAASAENNAAKNFPNADRKNPVTAQYVRNVLGTPANCGTTPMPTSVVPSALSAPPIVLFKLVISFSGISTSLDHRTCRHHLSCTANPQS
jgi:hypothetical protein